MRFNKICIIILFGSIASMLFAKACDDIPHEGVDWSGCTKKDMHLE